MLKDNTANALEPLSEQELQDIRERAEHWLGTSAGSECPCMMCLTARALVQSLSEIARLRSERVTLARLVVSMSDRPEPRYEYESEEEWRAAWKLAMSVLTEEETGR